MTATAVEPEPAESVAAAVAALTRALTGAVTEADGRVLNAAMEQVQCRLDAQDGRTGRVTYDVTDDHPGQTRGRLGGRGGGRGGAVRSVQLELPGGVATSLAALSEATGKDMAYLMATAVTLLHHVAEHLSAGRRVYAEDPDSGRRSAMTLDWA